jgi:hypothetical protein
MLFSYSLREKNLVPSSNIPDVISLVNYMKSQEKNKRQEIEQTKGKSEQKKEKTSETPVLFVRFVSSNLKHRIQIFKQNLCEKQTTSRRFHTLVFLSKAP